MSDIAVVWTTVGLPLDADGSPRDACYRGANWGSDIAVVRTTLGFSLYAES